MSGKEDIGITIRVIPAWRDPLPEFIPQWCRKLLCKIRGHRLISNAPACASGMVQYMQGLYDSGALVMHPSSCIDCGYVEPVLANGGVHVGLDSEI